MSKKIENIIIGLLTVSNILFFLYYVILAYYSQLHYDDLHFLWKLRDMSIFDYVRDMYYSRSGRFIGYGINGLIFKTILLTKHHQFWPIIFYLLGISGVFYVIKNVFNKVPSMHILIYVAFFYNIYVLTVIDYPVFFWLCAMLYYLLPVILIVHIYMILKSQHTILSRMGLFITSIILGGGHEAFSVSALGVMFICGIWLLRKNYKWSISAAWNDYRIKRLIVSTVIIIVCLAIVVIAPGNYQRLADASQFPKDLGIIEYILGFVNAGILFYYFEAFYIPYYIILAIVGVSIFRRYYKVVDLRLRKNYLLLILFFWMIYFVMAVIPSVFLWGGFGVQRNYTHVVFFFIIHIIGIFMVCFNQYKENRVIDFLSVLGILIMIFITSVNIYTDLPVAKAYSDAVNERIEYCKLLNTKDHRNIEKVATLPSIEIPDSKYNILHLLGIESTKSALYYVSDVDSIPNEYSSHFKRVYDLDFDIIK